MKRQTTKSTLFFNRLAIAFVALALALAALQPFRPSRANALPAWAVAATPQPKTDLDIFPLNSNGVVQAKSGGASWSSDVPGYNIVRTFNNFNNQPHVIMLNGNTGRGRTYALDNDGSLGALTWETGDNLISDLRCTSAETVKIGATTYLITHDSFTGKVRTFHFYDNGKPNFSSMGVTTLSDWKDKNLFSLYSFNGDYYLVGMDTWTGNAVAYSIDGQKIGENDWTRGWTSIDHLTVGSVTYRLIYKAAGDPNKKDDEDSDQRGRFVIQRVNADGVSGQNIYDAPVGADYSSVRFAPLHNGQNWEWSIFFFKRDTRHYVARQFDQQNGVGAVTALGLIKDGPEFDDIAPPYVDIEPYTIGVNTFLAAVSDDNSMPFHFGNVEKMAHAIHAELSNKVVGYQFMLAQSGRVIYSRAWGKSKLDHTPAEEIDMTSRTKLVLGSVGKMVTATTLLKLAENGLVNLNAPIADQIDPQKYPPDQLHNWVKQRPALNLLTHTTGMASGENKDCDAIGGYKVSCAEFFASAPTLTCQGNNCNRKYNNSNFGAARQIIEHVTNVDTAQGVVQKTHELWAAGVNLTGMTCKFDSDVYYFSNCNGANGCYGYAGRLWQRGQEGADWSDSCGAGGWSASSRDMIEYLAAIRYQKLLSTQFNNLLLNTELEDLSGNPGSTALSWEPPWDAGGVKNLGKNGSATHSGWGHRAYITRLPENCDAVILVNTAVSQHPLELLNNSYRYAVGINPEPPNYVDIAANGEASGGAISRVAVNNVKKIGDERRHVVAMRDGSLKLKAYSVSLDEGKITNKDNATAMTGAMAISAKEVAITNGVDFATASIANDDKLTVIAWKFDGNNLTQHGIKFGPTATKVAVTKVGGDGANGRVVTVIRNGAGNLQLDVWQFNNSNNTITLKDTYTAGAVGEVATGTLKFASDMSQTARFVTAVRNDAGQLQMDIWEVDGNGQLHRKGKALFGLVSGSSSIPKRIAIDTQGDEESDFFNGAGVMTASVNSDGDLDVVTWKVDSAGEITKKDEGGSSDATDLSIAATTTTARLSDGKLKLIKWLIDSGGTITRADQRESDSEITRVSAAGNVLTALQLSNGNLKLINWKITN